MNDDDIAVEDPLAPARGCVFGVLIGAAAWAIFIFVVWKATR